MAGDASDNLENDFMKLFFNATNWANVADNAVTSPVTSWAMGLYTASPGEGGNQTTNEATYTSYARQTVARTTGGFTVGATPASTVVLVAALNFPAGTGGSGTVTNMGLGNSTTSTGRLQMSGTVSPSIVTGSGVTPQLTTATTFSID